MTDTKITLQTITEDAYDFKIKTHSFIRLPVEHIIEATTCYRGVRS